MLFLRLLGPSQPLLDGSGLSALAALFPTGLPMCHAAEPGEKDPLPPTHDCQLCLACHAISQAPFLPVEPAFMHRPGAVVRVAVAALPPATGPPPQPWRRSAPPIGPPQLSI